MLHLIDDAIADAELLCESGKLGLTREKTVRSALDDKSVYLFRDDDAAEPALAFEDRYIIPGTGELPRGGQPGDSRPCDDDFQTQPRALAAACTTAATAATRPGSSFSECVRSSWIPSRFASA